MDIDIGMILRGKSLQLNLGTASWLIPWFAAIVWISLGEFARNSNFLRVNTESVIRANDHLIQSYVRKYGEAPPSLNELRFYSRMRGSRYESFDAWGGRFEYLRLGKINYTLRSFGADGIQNRLNSDPDPGVFRWGQMVSQGLQYDGERGLQQARPSVLLFAGADDEKRQWHAKLFLDNASGARRLLVRSRKILNLYMLAPHDGIEEFLWLSGTRDRIVFTASGSSRYADGIWIWDLGTDQSWNLLQFDERSRDLSPANKSRGLYVALSRAEGGDRPVIAAFVASSAGGPLDAEWFFHPRNLHLFKLRDDENFDHVNPNAEAEHAKSLFDYTWMDQLTVKSGGEGAALQRAWLKLPRTGNWEKAMSRWQDYAATHSQSPLAAYAIWSLAMFYRDAALEASGRPKEAEILRGYSFELAGALTKMSAAPGWMRAIGVGMLQLD